MDFQHSSPSPSADALTPVSGVVLVVDDEPLNIASIEDFLRGQGYRQMIGLRVDECSTEHLRECRPDLLLIELDPSRDSVYDILARMSADWMLRDVPVIGLCVTESQTDRLRALALGVNDLLLKPIDSAELLLRLRNCLRLKNRRDQLVHSDPVTGLPNRDALFTQLHLAIKQARRHDNIGAVIQVGLDRFKEISDAFGPALSDELLGCIAQRLQSGLREINTLVQAKHPWESVTLSHFRGDEFTVLLPQLEHVEQAAVVAQQVLELMAAPYAIEQQELFMSCRLGIAVFPLDSIDSDTLIKQASLAMAHVAETRSHGYHYYSSEINVRAATRLKVEREFRHALECDELRLHYQPKVDVKTGKIYSAECLVRWQHPDRGLVGPNEFIAVAENAGLINAMGDWVLRQAFSQMAQWRKSKVWVPTIAVNLSSLQLEREDFAGHVRQLLLDANLPGSCLCLELTESAILKMGMQTCNSLNELRALGIELSLDDFGTGYSSLSHLRKLPLDEIKIDRSFIMDCDTNANCGALTAAIIAMGHRLGLRVVAEGIETAEQLRFIANEGCDVYQGYHCSPAVPAPQFAELLHTYRDSGL